MILESKKKIAVFLPALEGGGAERSMLSLAGGIASEGHIVDLVLARATGAYMDEIPDDVHLVDLHCKGTFASLPALAKYLRRERPDGMISALSRANITAILARKLVGVPGRLVVNEQNNLSNWALDANNWRSRLTPRCASLSYRWADALVAVSQGVADDLVDICKIPAKRVEVIFNPGATPEVLRKAALPLEHSWFGEDQPPVLVAVGRLYPQKDFENLLHALARVRQSRDVRLMILGEGPERPKLEALMDRLNLRDDVQLPGFVDNPYQYMSRAAAFVLSSRFEGLPTVLVEAMMCGVPLISTDCPSGPQEILRGGQFGLLVPVGQRERLADAIEQTLDGNCPKTTADSWHPYTPDAVVSEYLELLFGSGS